jgi:type IV pilus assembly protein PilA
MKSISQGFTLVELMIVVAIIAILAAIAIPQYQTYVIKSQVVRAVGEASNARTLFEDCAAAGKVQLGTNGGQCDTSTLGSSDILQGASDVGATLPGGTGALHIQLPQNGTDTGFIRATLGNNVASQVSGGIVTWNRSPDGTWICSTDNKIGSKYAPSACPVVN